MKIILSGCGGRMGREIARFVNVLEADDVIVGGVDPTRTDFSFPVVRSFSCAEQSDEFCLSTKNADVIIDFSNHAAAKDVMAYALRRKLPVVMATTGHTDGEIKLIESASRTVPVFFSANMSTGVAVLAKVAKEIAKSLPETEVEIIETHHEKKEDAPSGTAIMLAEEIGSVREGVYTVIGRRGNGKRKRGEIGVHSLRLGGEIGRHEIIFGSYNQTVTVCHEAHSRAMYADGAIRAARFLLSKGEGLYSMKDMLTEVRE